MEGKRIGFISTRLSGTDGVSLEVRKWSDVLENGHKCFYMAGEVDTPKARSFFVPECHFTHPDVYRTHHACFGREQRDPATSRDVDELKHLLKKRIREFVDMFDLDLLIPENALTIPLNLSLGLAITEFIVENNIQIIAHHHDFFWERKRFLHNACWDYLRSAFPPHLQRMQHVVLNSSQDHQLSLRTGISASIIPNVMDYHKKPPAPDGYADDLRERLGILPGEKFILQPTRIVQRKGIERAIELVHRLKMPAKLVVSHSSGDEGDEYSVRVREYSELMQVETVFCSHLLGDERSVSPDGEKIYTLADLYQTADFVTYPSRVEGFGNAFLEAIYYKAPLMINNYSTYSYDIRPKGFKIVEMDDYITSRVVDEVREILGNPALRKEMTEHNFEVASKFFSYDILKQELNTLMLKAFGW